MRFALLRVAPFEIRRKLGLDVGVGALGGPMIAYGIGARI